MFDLCRFAFSTVPAGSRCDVWLQSRTSQGASSARSVRFSWSFGLLDVRCGFPRSAVVPEARGFPGGGFGANYRSGVRDIATGVSDCESESSDCGLGGRGRCSDDEDPYAEIRTGLADSSSEDGSEADDVRRCASPEALPLAVDVGSDEEAPAAAALVADVKQELVEPSGEPPSSSMAPAVPVQDLAAPAALLPPRLRLGEGVSMETELPDSKRVRVS